MHPAGVEELGKEDDDGELGYRERQDTRYKRNNRVVNGILHLLRFESCYVSTTAILDSGASKTDVCD